MTTRPKAVVPHVATVVVAIAISTAAAAVLVAVAYFGVHVLLVDCCLLLANKYAKQPSRGAQPEPTTKQLLRPKIKIKRVAPHPAE